MKHSYTIPVNVLRAVSLFSAVGDVRGYLNSVCLRTDAQDRLWFNATDGHTLAGYLLEGDGADYGTGRIIPSAFLAEVLKLAKKAKQQIVPFEFDTEQNAVTATLVGGDIRTAKMVEGRFPECERVVPRTFSGIAAWYNPEYLQRVLDAAVWLTAKGSEVKGWERLRIAYNSEGPALFALVDRPEFYAIVMPMKGLLAEREIYLPTGRVTREVLTKKVSW